MATKDELPQTGGLAKLCFRRRNAARAVSGHGHRCDGASPLSMSWPRQPRILRGPRSSHVSARFSGTRPPRLQGSASLHDSLTIFDFQGRQLSCEHLMRWGVRYENDGSVTVMSPSADPNATGCSWRRASRSVRGLREHAGGRARIASPDQAYRASLTISSRRAAPFHQGSSEAPRQCSALRPSLMRRTASSVVWVSL